MLIGSYKIGVSYLAILCMKKLRLKKAMFLLKVSHPHPDSNSDL